MRMAWASVSKGVEIVEDIIVIEESSVTLFTYTGTQVCSTNQRNPGFFATVTKELSLW